MVEHRAVPATAPKTVLPSKQKNIILDRPHGANERVLQHMDAHPKANLKISQVVDIHNSILSFTIPLLACLAHFPPWLS
jgi:hypothetical protein